MKKVISILVACMASIVMVNAQSLAFDQKTNVISVGVGVSSYINPSLAISAAYERGIYNFGNRFTIGIQAGVNVAPIEKAAFEVSLGPTFHFTPSERLDLYAGPTVFLYKNPYFSRVGVLGVAGVRYYFNKNLGVFANLGGIGLGNIGLAIKF